MRAKATTLVGDHLNSRFRIEDIYPSVDCGRYPVKRVVGEPVEAWADIFRDGHDVMTADLIWRPEGENKWRRAAMQHIGNDRWVGRFTPTDLGRHLFAVEAWTDLFGTWRHEVQLKRAAGQDVRLEAQEGRQLLGSLRPRERAARATIARTLEVFNQTGDVSVLLSDYLTDIVTSVQPRPDLTRSPLFALLAERPLARAGAWYEMVPRSQGTVPGRHGTFDDCIARLPEIAAHGFDVIYLTPIHPIGRTNRKGRNNSLTAGPDDPGSPYAIGSEEGGHDAVHPELGTIEDFRRFVAACRDHGMEVALDFAIQCSPDHPWVRDHPEWFKRRPDGSIRYAENPPKKYEDIVNPDFYGEERDAVWTALRDVVLFWVEQGVRIFRVDNPHTKPLAFWEWLIGELQDRDPGLIFLAEAFTRPKLMKGLAKLGYTQSYTYFTWRTTKSELSAYIHELTQYPMREYFRPNFFVNTPDINPFHLQSGEPWIFKARVALAATMSSNYGIYNGFELLEHEPIPGKEEYLDSEKYEIKVRNWHKPGNIFDYIGRLNRIRKENPALLQTSNFRFAQVDDDEVIGFVKESVDGENAIAAAIALSGHGPRQFWFHLAEIEIGPTNSRRRVKSLENLVTGERHMIEWGGVRLRIDQTQDPALLFRCHG